jgi:hypothetical protein
MVGGSCWILGALVLGSFVFQFTAHGAGLPFFWVSSGSVLFGLVHVVGFVSAACLCFVIGVGLCAHGLVPPSPSPTRKEVADASSAADLLNQFTVRFGEIGRTLEYDDLQSHIQFTFAVGSTGNKSLFLSHHAAQTFDESRYEIAFERTQQHLQSLGFSVEISER